MVTDSAAVLPCVALLAEGVDRNRKCRWIRRGDSSVALLAEGVDRNNVKSEVIWDKVYVALLAEGVDRNRYAEDVRVKNKMSPSSRRAWIEMPMNRLKFFQRIRVALLAEGVDRNISR